MSVRNWHRLGVMLVFIVIAIDQITKFSVFHDASIPDGPGKAILPIFSLVHWWNRGISFGMFNEAQTAFTQFGILVVLTLVIVTLLMYSMTRSTRGLTICAFGIIIGGALGNLIDRFHYGAVADFLYFHIGVHGFPAFNVADSCVCVGVGLLILDGFLAGRDKSASFIDS